MPELQPNLETLVKATRKGHELGGLQTQDIQESSVTTAMDISGQQGWKESGLGVFKSSLFFSIDRVVVLLKGLHLVVVAAKARSWAKPGGM